MEFFCCRNTSKIGDSEFSNNGCTFKVFDVALGCDRGTGMDPGTDDR